MMLLLGSKGNLGGEQKKNKRERNHSGTASVDRVLPESLLPNVHPSLVQSIQVVALVKEFICSVHQGPTKKLGVDNLFAFRTTKQNVTFILLEEWRCALNSDLSRVVYINVLKYKP